MIKAILDEVRAFCGEGEFGDDVCLVGLKVNELLAPQNITDPRTIIKGS